MRHLNLDEAWACVDSNGIELTPDMRDHLTVCTACQQRIATMQRANQGLMDILSKDGPIPSPTDDEKLLQVLREHANVGHNTGRRMKRWNWTMVSGLSAAVLLFGTLAAYMAHRGATGAPTESSSAGQMVAKISSVPSASPSSTMDTGMHSASSTYSGMNSGVAEKATQEITFTVHVQSISGTPISGAHAVFASDRYMLASSQTLANGTTTPIPVSISANGAPVVSDSRVYLIVWKNGYAPAVGLLVPATSGKSGNTQSVEVPLTPQAAAGQQVKPTGIPGTTMPSQSDARSMVQWALGQVK